MIHTVSIIILLGITHMISFLIMTEQKYSTRKMALIYSIFCAEFAFLAILPCTLLEDTVLYFAVGFISTIVMSFLVFLFTSADPTCKKIFLFISYSNVFCILGCFSLVLTNILFKNFSETFVIYVRNIIRTVLFIPVAVIYIRFLRPYVRAVSGKRRKTWYSISLPSVLFLVIFTIIFIELYANYGNFDEYILFFVVSVLIYGSILWVIFSTIGFMIDEINTELVKKNVAYLQDRLKTAGENEIAAKTIRHDFRHHNQNIVFMLNKGEVHKALKYLEEYNESLNATKLDKFCPNITVNAILSSFYTKAQNCGISVSVEADVKENTTTTDMDFVAILSNLLENALNGCIECESLGDIKVNIRTVADKTVIVCANPCVQGISIENNMIKNRGIGITSILSAIRKYDGDIKYSMENRILTACIILNS